MSLISRLRGMLKLKRICLILIDVLSLLASITISFFFAQFFADRLLPTNEFLPVCMTAFVIMGFVGLLCSGTYRSAVILDYISDLTRCAVGFIVGELCLCLIIAALDRSSFLPFILVSVVIGVFVLLIERLFYSIILKKVNYLANHNNMPTALIIGAGEAGRTVLSEIRRSKDHCYRVVGFVDDDPAKISQHIDNIYIYGPTVLIPELCEKHKVDEIIFAIPTCPEERKKQILNICSSTGCNIKVIPSLFDINEKTQFISQAKTIRVEDLLGRDVINLNNPQLADFVNNKVIFVTGVGSIGSELCRQIVKLGPKHLIMIDIYENNAYEIQQELIRNGYGNLISTEIASVRDSKKMQSLFAQYKPNIVFHAAAHKHVPLMETNPEEAIKNNVLGTFKVAKLCDEYGVKKMILISTDKAVNPTNIMGASKRCCEMIMQYMSQKGSKTEFAAVRFGNVLGSNGSVIPLFSKQIEAGGPVTVTHPDIIRYFMTIPEAVSLVLEAGTMAKGGEIFVLDMGEPVKITTLAENLIRLYGYEPYTEMPIKFVGLRPGEKLFEELLMSEEGLVSTENKKIFIGKQIEIDCDSFEGTIEKIGNAAKNNKKETVVEMLHNLVPTFHDQPDAKLNAKQ
ncbi:MAG: nucleoside-diphosphate sugar epimerase/dehydratase [Acutalibacteraceae bacterium]|nr:nucleoside-diphosphate sugar epimerase/dehydratase [Acutalibacteraceae bacterium]